MSASPAEQARASGAPLRVGLVVNSLGTGGVERQLLTLARGLDPAQFDVELIPLKSAGPQASEAAGMGVAVWSPEAVAGPDHRAITRLAQRLRARRFDVVLAANQYATFMLKAATLFGYRPRTLLSAFHSSPSHIGHHWRDRLRLGLYKLALRGFDGLVFVSARQRDEWHGLGLGNAQSSSVIYNGIDPSRFDRAPNRDVRAELSWPGNAFVVGLCAALRPEKRVPDLVRAVALARARGVPAHLLVIGDGPQRAIVESAMAEAGLQRFSHITGLQPDVAPFIHACDAMALVSSAEAFSMSVLESMACGKPVVLTEVGGAAEQIEQGVHGYRVPVGRPEAVADCLLKLWQEGSAARLGAHGRERLRHEFSLQRMLDDYGALFRGAGPARVPSAADTARPVSPSISQS